MTLLYAMLLQAIPDLRVNSFQWPSETTSTVPSTTFMAVSSSIAYPDTRIPARFAGVHCIIILVIFRGAMLGAFYLSQCTHKRTLPTNANPMKNATKPNLFSCQRDHQELHIRHEYPPPFCPPRLPDNQAGTGAEWTIPSFSLAENSFWLFFQI